MAFPVKAKINYSANFTPGNFKLAKKEIRYNWIGEGYNSVYTPEEQNAKPKINVIRLSTMIKNNLDPSSSSSNPYYGKDLVGKSFNAQNEIIGSILQDIASKQDEYKKKLAEYEQELLAQQQLAEQSANKNNNNGGNDTANNDKGEN